MSAHQLETHVAVLEQHGLWLKQGWLMTCRAGAFCGILLLSGLSQWLEPAYNLPLLYASFGASAVLVFGVISSPLAQPRNFVGKCISSWIWITSFHVSRCMRFFDKC